MKRYSIVAVSGLAALALAACGTGGTTAPPEGDVGDISDTVTDEPVTLTVSYVEDPPIGPLVDGFTEMYPNVEVELIQTPFVDYQTSLRLALDSDDSPDIVQYSPGPMRSIVPAGLVRPLDDYAELYGWKDRVPETILGMLHSNEEATQYGTGNLYAIPGAIQVVGVFYNRELTEAAGITDTPATLEEFEEHMDAVQDSGVIPLSLPALEVGGFQMWGALANVHADVDLFNSWVYGEPGSDLTEDPGFAEAAATLQEWGEAGYFADGVAAVADNDGVAEFSAGERAYFVTGNWNTDAFVEALGDDVGFFLMPGTEADQPDVTMGSGYPYSISSKTEHPDVAAALLDYMVSPEAAEGIYNSGFVPVTSDDSLATSGVRGDILEGYEQAAGGNGVAPFPNWASTSMLETLTTGVQGIISGNMTPDEYVQSLQNDWESNQS